MDQAQTATPWKHEVFEIKPGLKSLKEALAEIDESGLEVVSVFPNTGGPMMSWLGSGQVYSLLIVVRGRRENASAVASGSLP